MSRSVLRVVDHAIGYALAWVEDGEIGAYIGDFHNLTEKTSRKDRDTRECFLAEKAAQVSNGKYSTFHGIYTWDTKRDAEAVRKAALLAIKTDVAEMPAWATKALAEGWKPPKGWKP